MAFEKNNHIKKVILPAQLKIIEKRAFNTCEKLEQVKVKIPTSVTYIGNSAFNMDINLLLASLPDSLTEIGEWAFWGCKSLTNINIPNSVTTIGDSAFCYFESLTNINIPNSVTTIGDWGLGRANPSPASQFRIA